MTRKQKETLVSGVSEDSSTQMKTKKSKSEVLGDQYRHFIIHLLERCGDLEFPARGLFFAKPGQDPQLIAERIASVWRTEKEGVPCQLNEQGAYECADVWVTVDHVDKIPQKHYRFLAQHDYLYDFTPPEPR